ncbi:MAG: GGDEF domain-containing protein, partial [Planctomycetota bacterium]
GEHRLCKAGVEGSSPSVSTLFSITRQPPSLTQTPKAFDYFGCWEKIVVQPPTALFHSHFFTMPIPDHVTGLESRGELEAFLAHRLTGLVHATSQKEAPLAIVAVDVVGLKNVNAKEGFLAGDALLRTAANRLRRACKQACLIARLGGDELVAVFTGADAVQKARHALEEIRVDVSDPQLRSNLAVAHPTDSPAALIDRSYSAVREQGGGN